MLVFGVATDCSGGPNRDRSTSDTIRMSDTVRIPAPNFKSELGLGTVIVRVPMFKGTGAGGLVRLCSSDKVSIRPLGAVDSVTPVRSNKDAADIIDSIRVELPLVQRVYENEDYTAWVSGVEPKLDSIAIVRRRERVEIRHPPNRWHIGPTVGVGITAAGIKPFAGVSITYSIFSF